MGATAYGYGVLFGGDQNVNVLNATKMFTFND